MHNQVSKIEFNHFLEVVEITHSKQQSFIKIAQTTAEERGKRSSLMRSLLRQAGMLAIGLAPDNEHPVLHYGNCLMQLHKVFSSAINKPQISGDMAIKGLMSYVGLLLDDYGKALGVSDYCPNSEKDIELLSKVNRSANKEDLGIVTALQNLFVILMEAISCADYNHEERKQQLLLAPQTLLEVVGESKPLPTFGGAINA